MSGCRTGIDRMHRPFDCCPGRGPDVIEWLHSPRMCRLRMTDVAQMASILAEVGTLAEAGAAGGPWCSAIVAVWAWAWKPVQPLAGPTPAAQGHISYTEACRRYRLGRRRNVASWSLPDELEILVSIMAESSRFGL